MRVKFYGVEMIEREVSGGHQSCALFQVLPDRSDDYNTVPFFTGTRGECARYLSVLAEKHRARWSGRTPMLATEPATTAWDGRRFREAVGQR